jgi:hypothetical protein
MGGRKKGKEGVLDDEEKEAKEKREKNEEEREGKEYGTAGDDNESSDNKNKSDIKSANCMSNGLGVEKSRKAVCEAKESSLRGFWLLNRRSGRRREAGKFCFSLFLRLYRRHHQKAMILPLQEH